MVVWQHLFGINSVLAALNAQKRIFQTLMIAEPVSEKHLIVSKANELGLNFKAVDRKEVEKWATGKNHQGVVLKASELKPVPIKHAKEIVDDGPSVWLGLDHVTDPQNFGSILRSAYFFGVQGVLVPTRNTAPLSSTVSKVSSGSLEYLDIYETHDLGSFVQDMKTENWSIIGASVEKGSKALKPLSKKHKTLLLLGNEGEGISKKLKKLCDEIYFIKGGNQSVDSLNLWDCFDAVKDQWNENRALLESYSELARLRTELEKSVIKRLEKIIQLPIFKLGKNTLLPLIEKMQSFYSSKLISSKNFVSSLNTEVLLPLKDLMHSQELKIRDQVEACRKLEVDKKKLLKNLETSKEKYWKQCKENSINKSKAETNNKESLSLEKYLISIEAINRFQMIFTEDMGKHLAVFQINEEERLKHFRESLRKFVEFELGLMNSPLSEAEGLPIVNSNQAVNVFNPITELSKFIDDTKTDKPVSLVFFEPSPFGSTCPTPESRSSPEDHFMQKMIIKCWEGLGLTEEDSKIFESVVSTQEGRKSWLYYLNERRIKSQFLIPVSGFALMNKLLAVLLNHIELHQDQNSAKLTIVLSQTFYCEKTGEKVYLHLAVGQHQIWHQEKIWVSMIESGIEGEMQNYALFCSDETSEEHKERMGAILASQLSSYVHIMKSFNMGQEFVREVAGKLIEKYKIKEVRVEDFVF